MRNLSDIDLKLLRIFVSVADANGFANAQYALGLSPSTISIRIKELEARVGFRLCTRGRAGFRLTDMGRVFLQEGRHLLQFVHGFVSRVTSMQGGAGGTLAFGMVDALVTARGFPLSRVIGEMSKSVSGLFIELKVAPRPQLESLVLDGQLDAAIGPFSRPLAGLRRRSLFVEEHHVFCGRGHELFTAVEKLSGPADLANYPVVVRGYAEEFDLRRFGPARALALTDSLEGVLAMVLSGCYLGYLPAHYAEHWIGKGLLRAIRLRTLSYRSQHSLLMRSGKNSKPLLEAFASKLLWQIRREAQKSS